MPRAVAKSAAADQKAPAENAGQMEEGGATTLSPPHTWTESDERTEQDDEAGESRHLFTVVITIPEGRILNSRVMSDVVPEEELRVGQNIFPVMEGKAQSFVLTAAVSSSPRQRLFCRMKTVPMSSAACELLCEFENNRARITALALRPAFGPSTPFHSITFTTKHAANCAVTHIDYTSIPYLGHLPTDVMGKSILSFVYAPDVNVVRQAHIDLYNARGKVVKSIAPLRFVAYNGALLRAETEWSAYVNPWTKRIEMVVARHRIVDAPIGDANVLSAPPEGQPTNVLPPPMAKAFEDELRMLMSRPVPSSRTGTMCQPAPRPTDLGAYIDRIVETLVVSSTGNNNQPAKCVSGPSQEESTDLPLSFAQINCLENVHRLLKSQSRPESPRSDSMDDSRRPITSLPLTKEVLMQHTKRCKDEDKETWHRRLKRMSTESMTSSGPQAKHSRPSTSSTPPAHWTHAQRDDYYRSLAPNPPPPPGKNYQITYVPLPPHDSCTPSTASMPEQRSSAFTAVQPKAVPVRDLPPPIALTIQEHPTVIHTPSDSLMMTLHPAAASRLLYAHRVQSPSNNHRGTPVSQQHQQQQQQPQSLMLHE